MLLAVISDTVTEFTKKKKLVQNNSNETTDVSSTPVVSI